MQRPLDGGRVDGHELKRAAAAVATGSGDLEEASSDGVASVGLGLHELSLATMATPSQLVALMALTASRAASSSHMCTKPERRPLSSVERIKSTRLTRPKAEAIAFMRPLGKVWCTFLKKMRASTGGLVGASASPCGAIVGAT